MTDLRRRSDTGFGELDGTGPHTAIPEISDPVERRHVELLNQHIARTHELAAANREIIRLTTLAYFDKLTGLANQRLLEEAFDKAVEKDEKIVLLFIDLNKFKQINDTYGHHIGDEALKVASRTLVSLTRANDMVAHIEGEAHLPVRYAGDEFIIMFTGVTLDELRNKLVIVKEAFNKLTFVSDGTEIPVGASIGAYERKEGESLEHCKKQADKAMYEDKHAGKENATILPFSRWAIGYPTPGNGSVIPSLKGYLTVANDYKHE